MSAMDVDGGFAAEMRLLPRLRREKAFLSGVNLNVVNSRDKNFVPRLEIFRKCVKF